MADGGSLSLCNTANRRVRSRKKGSTWWLDLKLVGLLLVVPWRINWVLVLRQYVKGKATSKTIEATYQKEYGVDILTLHEDAIKPGQRVLICDDLLATGGTIKSNDRTCGKN